MERDKKRETQGSEHIRETHTWSGEVDIYGGRHAQRKTHTRKDKHGGRYI